MYSLLFYLLIFSFAFFFFFFNDTATTEIYTLSLHDALPIYKLDILAGRIYDTVMADDSGLCAKHALLNPYLNERQRRLVAAADARFLGHGGIASLARAPGLSRTTLHKAVRELEGNEVPPERVRKAGGGRKSKAEQDPGLVKELERLVEGVTSR